MNRRSLLKGLAALAGVFGFAKGAKATPTPRTATEVTLEEQERNPAESLFDLVNGMEDYHVLEGDLLVLSTDGQPGQPLYALAIIARPEDAAREGWMIFRALHDAAPGQTVRCRWERWHKAPQISERGKFRAFQGLSRLKGHSVADVEHARQAMEASERWLWGLE